MNIMNKLVLVFLVFFIGVTHAQQAPSYRTYVDLYNQVMTGKRELNSLTQVEKSGVIAVHATIHNSCSRLDGECATACNAANALKDAASYLQSCAARHDYAEDCSRKFRDVRHAFDDYETAVSAAAHSCS